MNLKTPEAFINWIMRKLFYNSRDIYSESQYESFTEADV